jgi:hypothetical protein
MAGPGDFYDPLAPQPIPVPSADPFADLRPTWEQFLASQIAAAEPAPPPVPVAPPPDLGEMPADVVAAAPVDPYAPAFGQPGIGVPTEAVDQVAATVPQQVPQVPDYSPPFLSDAIEGAAQLANDKTTGGYAGPLDLDPNAPQASLEQREGHRFGQMSTEDLLEDRANRDRVKREMEAAEMLRLATADRENAEAEEKAWRTSREQAAQKRAEVEAEAAKLSDDPTGDWMDEVGTGRTIGAFIAVALGGLVQHLNGGRNSGMDQINLQIDRYVSERRKNLQDKRQGVADLQQQAEEDFRIGTTLRVASYERGIREITAKQAAFDVQGAAFNDLEMQKRQLAAAQQQALIAQEEKDRKRLFDEAKIEADVAKTAAEIAEIEARTAGIQAKSPGGGAGGGAGKPKPGDEPLTREQILAEMPHIDPDLLPPEGITVTRGQFERSLKTNKAAAEASKAVGEAKADAVPDMVTLDDKPYRARSKEDADEISDDKAITDEAIDILDRVIRYRENGGGWEPNFWMSDEGKKAIVDWNALVLIKKNRDKLGALSGSDIELELNSMGTKDPTGAKDPTPGLVQFRNNLVHGLNVKANAKRRPGTPKVKPYKPANLSKLAPPTKAPEDDSIARLMDEPSIERFMAEGNKTIPTDQIRTTLLPSQARILDRFEALARNPDASEEERAKAAVTLGKVLDRTRSEAVVEAVRDLLVRVNTGPIDDPGARTRTQSARDSLAEPK